MSQSSIQKTSIQESNPYLKYNIKSMIGQGQYGKVYLAQLITTSHLQSHHQTYAMKIIPTYKMKKNPKLKQLLKNEVEILCTLKHKNIIDFQEIYVWEKKIYMVYEYCEGGDLEGKIPLPQKDLVTVAKKIISACLFASKNSIIHRDLKPANILFKNGKIKVADWGFSRFLKGENNAESFIGSPAYMAPQILKEHQYSSKADVWSFGMMIYECLTGQFPWNGNTIKKLLSSIETKPLKIPSHICPVLKKILKQSLVVNPAQRSSFSSLQSLFETKTKAKKENPEDTYQKTENQLTVDEVRKCSFYLQMAKKLGQFTCDEAKNICLDIIIENLEELQEKSDNSFFNKSELVPKSSKLKLDYPSTKTEKKSNFFSVSRQLSKTKSQGKIKKSSKDKSLSKILKEKKSQTLLLLEKEIEIIKRMRNISSKKKLILYEQTHNKKIKILINTILNGIQPSKGDSSNRENRGKEKKRLAEMNCLLDVIMYKQLPEEYKEKDFSDYVLDLEESSRSTLLKLLNHKILYINKKYCRS